jgi:hypothetical protein
MKRLFTTSLAAAGIVLGLAACDLDYITDLDTENPNQPDLRRAMSNPSDVESMIGSSWRPHWNYSQGTTSSNMALSVMAHELTTTVGNFGVLELSREPRNWAYNNHEAYAERWLNQEPWYSLYGGLASANDGLRLIDGGMRMVTGTGAQQVDNTPRARTFAKFMQGVLLGHIGLYFDKAILAVETTDLAGPEGRTYVPYTDIRDQAIASLKEAAQLAEQNPFVLPRTWIHGLELTNTELSQVANSYIARLLVYNARTPQERAAVDWNAVLTHLDRGITRDHAPQGEVSVLHALYRAYTHHAWFWADYRTVGPADVSGQYQAWINAPVEARNRFLITTPDRRIAGLNGTTNAGTYFQYDPGLGVLNPDRGLYNFSFYRMNRWNRAVLGGYQTQPITTMGVAEMDLLRAEALFRLNRPAEAAALVNKTRVTSGQLPAVTADGVPQSADCVPRKNSGACGDLWDALMYEKHLETMGTFSALAWFDRRGWGTLSPGTMTQMPVPGREISLMRMEPYTFGGSGDGSAQ